MTPSTTPTAFISYSWEAPEHTAWVRSFATRLRNDGVNVTLDQWHAVPGDQLPAFMEKSIRENDFVLIICTPTYKDKVDHRKGGAGYEGDVITSEMFTQQNQRKFIPILRFGQWIAAAPSAITGKYHIDLREVNPNFEEAYARLLDALYKTNPGAPPLGTRPSAEPVTSPPSLQAKPRTSRLPRHASDMETISFRGSSVPKGLRETLQREADRRGINLTLLVGACFEYAYANRLIFETPLENIGEPGGESIQGLIPVGLKEKLDEWAMHRLGSRCNLLVYVLQKVVEQELYDDVFRYKQSRIYHKKNAW